MAPKSSHTNSLVKTTNVNFHGLRTSGYRLRTSVNHFKTILTKQTLGFDEHAPPFQLRLCCVLCTVIMILFSQASSLLSHVFLHLNIVANFFAILLLASIYFLFLLDFLRHTLRLRKNVKCVRSCNTKPCGYKALLVCMLLISQYKSSAGH